LLIIISKEINTRLLSTYLTPFNAIIVLW